MDAIRARYWKMFGHAPRHPEELYNITIVGMIEGIKIAGCPLR